MPCFLKRTTLTPGIRTPKRKAGENSLARVSQLGVFHLPNPTQDGITRNEGARAPAYLVTVDIDLWVVIEVVNEGKGRSFLASLGSLSSAGGVTLIRSLLI